MESNSQIGQDIFVSKMLDGKKNGYFLEIGSNDPIHINNTYFLEKNYNWTGLMIDYDASFEESYKKIRPNSHYMIGDAVEMNYSEKLESLNFPKDMDYLQIDLEVSNGSTLNTLFNLDMNVFNKYRFATVTFEHDIYTGNYYDTRNISRQIFESNGYVMVFSDVRNGSCPFEDWYVHPSLVDSTKIKILKSVSNVLKSILDSDNISLEYKDILKILNNL